MRLKTVRVTNSRNVLVQIPTSVVDKWGIKEGDALEVLDDGTGSIVIRPTGRFINVRPGGCANEKSKGVSK